MEGLGLLCVALGLLLGWIGLDPLGQIFHTRQQRIDVVSKFSALKIPTEVAQKMEICDPVTGLPILGKETGAPGGFIELLSEDSKVGQTFMREAVDRRSQRKTKFSAAELEEEQIRRAAKLTKSWSLVDLEGQPIDVEFTEANAIELYREVGWIFEQVIEFTGNRKNFKKA